MFEDTQRSYGGYGNDPSSRNGGGGGNGGGGNSIVTLRTIRQFFELLMSLVEQDPYFQRPCVLAWVKVSHYFLALPQLEPVRAEYLATCLTTAINDLLSLAERHHFSDLILQSIAQIFIEHTALDGRRGIAECIHMFFQILVRRDFAERSPEDAAASEMFGKKMRKICELAGMPTIRVKVKVLDDEEAARLAAIRRAEEEEKKRIAAEEAERVRQELEEREDQLAIESGKERRKKYVRQPLYVAPAPAVNLEEVPSGTSIFEHKRNLHWVKNNIILDLLMDRVLVGISRVDYNKQLGKRSVVVSSNSVNASGISIGGAGMPESFWSGWQRGKTYEQQQQEKRQEEESEAQRRDILRKIRDQEVKDALKTSAYRADVKKLYQLFATEQQHVVEEEQDRRALISSTYLKTLVSLYHMFREEHEHYTISKESASRQRTEEIRRRQLEERQRAKEKISKYWEEKEHLETRLEEHRRLAAEEQAARNEQQKKAYLEGQKRKLMTWRLENQYDAGGTGTAGDQHGVLLSSTSTTMTDDGPGRPIPAKKIGKGGGAPSAVTKQSSEAQQPDAARRIGHTKLAPLTERSKQQQGGNGPNRGGGGGDGQHRPRRRSSEPVSGLDGIHIPENDDDGESGVLPEHRLAASDIRSDGDDDE